MKNNDLHYNKAATTRHAHRGKFLKILAWTLGGFIAIVIILAAGITLWLTPDRLSSIISKEASKYLRADVRVSNPSFSIWSSFPWLTLHSDSITVISHSLDNLTPTQKRQLPDDAAILFKASSFSGKINLPKCFSKDLVIRDVELDAPEINLVAVNDSIANYNILIPRENKMPKIKSVSLNSVKLSKPGRISYFAADKRIDADVSLGDVSLKSTDATDRSFRLDLPGTLSLSYGGKRLLENFLISLGGNIGLSRNPLAFNLKDFDVDLGVVKGKISLDILAGDNPQVRNFSYTVDEFNADALLPQLPVLVGLPALSPSEAKLIKKIASGLVLSLSANLTHPYSLTSTTLPFIDLTCNVRPMALDIDLPGNAPLPLQTGPLALRFSLNGDNPTASTIRITPVNVRTDGIDATLTPEISGDLTAPALKANLQADADLQRLSRLLAKLPDMPRINVSGHAEINAEMAGSLAGSNPLQSLFLKGKTDITRLNYSFPLNAGRLRADNLLLDFSYSSGHADVRLKGGTFSYSSPADSLRLKASGLNLQAIVPLTSDPLTDGASFSLASGPLSFAAPGIAYSGKSLAVKGSSARRSSRPAKIPAAARLPWPTADSLTRRLQKHSPMVLTASLPKNIVRLLNILDVNVDIDASGGLLSTPSFPVANRIGRLQASLNPDSVNIRRLDFHSQSTGLTMKGTVSNLRQFLSGPGPYPLVADISILFDTIQINQLARAYESGVAITRSTNSLMPSVKHSAPSDTVAFLIPRNLIVNLRLGARETVYTNLHLYDLGALIRVADGNAAITDLTAETDFCHARAAVGFNTSDLQSMGLDLDLAIEDIELTEFFDNFHTLLLMMPQMKNLEGNLGVGVKGYVGIYPDMYLDMPGLHADINLTGRELTVHQSHFIRRVTKMLLIRNSGDLHIHDMNVRASVHDNLLELYPFNFILDSYSLNMKGLNNFNGDLYYHVGVMHSPLHIPFGINIEGEFSKPKLSFGGAHYKPRNAQKITSAIMPTLKINLIRELRYYLKEFVEKAADADSSDNSQYLYYVPDYRKLRQEARGNSSPNPKKK